MEYRRDDKIRFGQQVVREAKKTARVDTGFLKRSIRATLSKGVVEFRLIDYGAYNNNSNIVEVAKDIMPKEIEWKIIFVDEDGRETPVEGKTRTGRTISRKSISSENVSTNKIKSLIKALQNGQKANNKREADSGSDKEKS
jgi:hypothetical protein